MFDTFETFEINRNSVTLRGRRAGCLPCGHYIAEEIPALLLQYVQQFLRN